MDAPTELVGFVRVSYGNNRAKLKECSDRDIQRPNHKRQQRQDLGLSIQRQAHDNRDRNHQRDKVRKDIGGHHGVSRGDSCLAILVELLGATQYSRQMGPTLEEASEDECHHPEGDDGGPDHEEAAEDDPGEEVPVEEADGELDEACSGYADHHEGEVDLELGLLKWALRSS